MFELMPIVILAAANPAPASRHLVSDATFRAIASEMSGELAQETTRRIVDQHRIQGSTMMAKSAELVRGELEAAGLEVKIESFVSDGATAYGTWVSPLGWEIKRGELWVIAAGKGDAAKHFEPYRVARYADVPMSVSTYSKGGEWTGELIDVGPGTDDAHYAGKNVAGKVVLASGYAANVHAKAVLARKAAGVVIYPRANDRADHPDLIRYNGLWTRAKDIPRASGGFQISANQYAKLEALMESGPVRVKGSIDATLGPGKLTLVHAWIRGTAKEEVVLTAHLDHPKWSANDNASGSGALVEVARTLSTLIAKGAIAKPRRTIHFIWVPEFYGTLAYVSAHPEIRRCGTAPTESCVVANINMDMIGEDTVKTNSRFYFTRSLDSVPSILDGVLGDLLEQTREAELYAPTGTRHLWHAAPSAYAPGSDHDVFLGLGIPATMFGHWPDWTHHSSEDRIDKTDASELLRVSVFAAAAAHWLAAAGEPELARAEIFRRTEELARLGERLRTSPAKSATRVANRIAEVSAAITRGTPVAPAPAGKTGPRRLALLPFDDSVFEDLDKEEQKFWDEAESRFELPNFDRSIVVFEAVNLMDGKTSPAELAEKLSDELSIEIETAFVERLITLLAKRRLVSPGG